MQRGNVNVTDELMLAINGEWSKMQELKTPYYMINEANLVYDIELLRRSLEKSWGNYVMGYSVKTNSLPWLLTYLKKHGFFAEVVSEQEYELSEILGYKDNRIIYNGPIKDKSVFAKVLENGGYVNLDSSYEPEWLEELCKNNPGNTYKVGLRVNADMSAMCPDEELLEEDGGRFGYCYENGDLEQVIDRIKAIPNAKIAGLHLHTSTKSRRPAVFAALAALAVKVAKEYSLSLEYVDMGGGYFGGRSDMPSYADYMPAICDELRKFFYPEKTKLIVEPGVSLISRAISFETSVIDVKDIRDIRYVVTDGSRVNLNPQVTRHSYPHHIEYAKETVRQDTIPIQWVCGATCMEYDRLFPIENDVELKAGDRIIYDTAGGYTMCLSPLFIHYFPAVYVERRDGTLFTARKEWTNNEFLSRNYYEQDN